MSLNLPSEGETALCKYRVLYLGTTYYANPTSDGNIKINLKLIQDTIAKRYPVNGEKYAEGIETSLAVYSNGIQIEHTKPADDAQSDGTFFFPIKSLVYCGALRLIRNEKAAMTEQKWKFVPLDSELANDSRNLKYPPLFVVIVRGVDPSSKGENIECHVFVIGMKKTAMKLVESSQRAYNSSNQSVTQFRNKYGNVPAVFTSSDSVNGAQIVKKHDKNGFFYVINAAAIDLWQLYETDATSSSNDIAYHRSRKSTSTESVASTNSDNWRVSARPSHSNTRVVDSTELLDPYQDAPNLVRVERKVDPRTGQNIYVRWLAEEPQIEETRIIERERNVTPSPPPPPLIIRESEPTPEPIVVEKIIQKKKPQLIIKEIHVNEPAPPPIKVVEEVYNDSNSTVLEPKTIYKNPTRRKTQYTHHQKIKVPDYSHFAHPDFYTHHRSRHRDHNYDFINNTNDVYNLHRKLYQPANDYYYSASADNYLYEPAAPSPVYTYHHHRRHRRHHSNNRPEHHHHHHHQSSKPHHNRPHVPTAKVEEVVFRKQRNAAAKSEVIGSKHQRSPPPPLKEQSKEYRKVFVANNNSPQQQQQQQQNTYRPIPQKSAFNSTNKKPMSPLKQQQANYVYGNIQAAQQGVHFG